MPDRFTGPRDNVFCFLLRLNVSHFRMFSLFRRKAALPVSLEPTFNERVDAFWKWYAESAVRFYQTIEQKRCADLTDEVSAKVDELLTGFAWVFGPGENGGHSFTLSGEGVIHRQLLALQWLSRAPGLPGWTFYASRPTGTISGISIEIGGISFSAKEIWVTPRIDRENECFDLTFWHPAWETLEESQKYRVTFLFLDEALGEYGTGWWIGRIDFGKDKLAHSFPLEELAGHMRDLSAAEGWKKYLPGECTTLLRFKEINGAYPRSDTFTQATVAPALIRDYFDADGDLENPLAGTGADYVYVSLPNHLLPKGDEVAKRGEFEDALNDALAPGGLGRWIGGAQGRERFYVDLLLVDGVRSMDAVVATLRQLKVPAGTMIEFFAREKLGRRIAL